MAAGKKQINVGVAGIGRIGKVHLENLMHGRIAHAQLKAICDPEIKKKGHNYKNLRVYEDYTDMLQTEKLDAVIICSPTPLHFDMIEKAFSFGLHVFCEKPLDPDLKNIAQLFQFSSKSKLCLQVGFNRRFDPTFINLHKQRSSQSIGDIHLIKITSRDPAPPPLSYLKSSGGMFMDMSIHDFDMARHLIGSEVTEVFAQGGIYCESYFAEADDIDTAVIQLKFENGALGIIDNSRNAVYGYDQRIELLGAEGMLQAHNVCPIQTTLHTDQGRWHRPPYHFFMDRYIDSYRLEIESFVHTVIEKKTPMVTAYDAYQATAIAVAANNSLNSRKVISVVSSAESLR